MNRSRNSRAGSLRSFTSTPGPVILNVLSPPRFSLVSGHECALASDNENNIWRKLGRSTAASAEVALFFSAIISILFDGHHLAVSYAYRILSGDSATDCWRRCGAVMHAVHLDLGGHGGRDSGLLHHLACCRESSNDIRIRRWRGLRGTGSGSFAALDVSRESVQRVGNHSRCVRVEYYRVDLIGTLCTCGLAAEFHWPFCFHPIRNGWINRDRVCHKNLHVSIQTDNKLNATEQNDALISSTPAGGAWESIVTQIQLSAG